MDPLSALSVAGTIVQLVQFGKEILSDARDLYRSTKGSLEVSQELELVTGDLQAVLGKLRANASSGNSTSLAPPSQPSAENDVNRDGFDEICNNAKLIAQELFDKINKLKVKDGKSRVWETLKAALRTAWSKDEILALKNRLSGLTESLMPRVLLKIGENINATHLSLSSRFDILDMHTKQIFKAILDSKGSLSQEIVKSLALLICRSESINEDAHHRTRQMIVDLRNDLFSGISGVDLITARVEMLDVEPENERQLRNNVNRTILEQISYPHMTNRYEEIQEAHSKTFDWIFCDAEQSGRPWDDFTKWLRHDSNIYWINGKAGSGKSTLMKHIYDSHLTAEFLRDWSRNQLHEASRCCIATFFFWNSGTDMQRSQHGLLRSLLFQVLHRNPEVIPLVLPAQWAENYENQSNPQHLLEIKTWSLRELHEAFERLIQQQQNQMIPWCFFVDGLDEFSGDSEQLCLFFQRLDQQSKMAKFCLSSRPWVAFQEHLGHYPNLRLQDLTFSDIEIYVTSKFEGSRAFMKLADRDPHLLESLKVEIMERTQGVFLWVKVVIEQLLRGANNRDSIGELWKRLRSFPRELYPLYNALLEQIEPVYLEWASRAFQIMRRTAQLERDPFQRNSNVTAPDRRPTGSREPQCIPLSFGEPLPRGASALPLTVLFLWAALCDDVHLEDLRKMSKEDLNVRCEDTRIHLTARCAGLLEVSGAKSSRPKFSQGSTIVYMHRTARDFLEKESQWSRILSWTTQSRFLPDLAMLKASVTMLVSECFLGTDNAHARHRKFPGDLLLIGVPPFDRSLIGISEDCRRVAEDVIIYAYQLDDDETSLYEQLKYLKIFNTWRTRLIPSTRNVTADFQDKDWLLGFAVLGLTGYVRSTLENESSARKAEILGVLLRALCSSEHFKPSVPFPKIKMVRMLSKMGSDHVCKLPYALPRLKAGPLWPDTFRSGVDNLETRATPDLMKTYATILEVFLAAGIDPTDISSMVPPDYQLRRKSFEQELFLELSSLTRSVNASTLFYVGKNVFDRSVHAHRMSKIDGVTGDDRGEASRKRKLIDETEAEESSGRMKRENGNDHNEAKRLRYPMEEGYPTMMM